MKPGPWRWGGARPLAAAALVLAVAGGCSVSGPGEPSPQPADAAAPVLDGSPGAAGSVDSTASRFYSGLPYGSESQLNPLTQLLNEGLDMLRMDGTDRHVLDSRWQWSRRLQGVYRSVVRADRSYERYGWGRALRNEILPLTFSKADGGGAWAPNYSFHLVGSGMVSARMTEWYEQHGVPEPALLSFLTMTASHVLNEAVENGFDDRSEDAATDLLLFDPAGFLLFRSERVQRFFSETLQLTNWPGQPAWVLPDHTLENTSQEFVLRGPLPGTQRWRWLYGFGAEMLVGVSRELRGGYAFSLAVGGDAVRVRELDATTGTKTVDFRPVGGVFLDRRGSLLLSVRSMVGRDVDIYGSDASLSAYLYPAVISVRGVRSPGVWVQKLRRGGIRLGVVPPFGLGLGWAK